MKLFKLLGLIGLLSATISVLGMNKDEDRVSRQDIRTKAAIEQYNNQVSDLETKINEQDKNKPTTKLHLAAQFDYYEFIFVWLNQNHKNPDFKEQLNKKNHALLTVKGVASYSGNHEIVDLIEKYEQV